MEDKNKPAIRKYFTMDKKIDLNWLQTCITAGEFLYGEYPAEVLIELYKTLYPMRIDRLTMEDIESFDFTSLMMDFDGTMITPVIITEGNTSKMFRAADKNGNPYASLHFDLGELLVLRKENAIIADQPYWKPNARQIEKLVNTGYIRSSAMTALEKKIKSMGKDPSFLKTVWAKVSADKLETMDSINAVISSIYPDAFGKYPDAIGIKNSDDNQKKDLPTMEDLKAVMLLINEFLNSINLRRRKGWPPSELAKRTPKYKGAPTIIPGSVNMAKSLKGAEAKMKEMGMNVDYSSIDSFATVGEFGERKIVRVGPNDPCPCGSGKKYKNCHGM